MFPDRVVEVGVGLEGRGVLRVSVVVPAFNEEDTIVSVVEECSRYVDEVVVVDDGSWDNTGRLASEAGARVVRQERNLGVLKAFQRGVREARGDIIVTLDADGQHFPSDVPRLLAPVLSDEADMVLGVRRDLPHFSERVLTKLTSLRVRCSDVSTGFRAVRRGLAEKMRLRGTCLCGILQLEAYRLGGRIMEVSIEVKERKKGQKRRLRTRHIRQLFYVLFKLVSL